MSAGKNQRFVYFKTSYAIEVHDWIIENSGGLAGVKNAGQIDSSLAHIQNDEYYPELEDKLTHLVFSINKSHAFNDGNKRASIMLGAYFLELNGFDYLVNFFVRQMENIAVAIAADTVNKEELGQIIYEILYEDGYSDSVKILILRATQNLA